MSPRVLPASCRQTNRRKALPARCRQHLGGAVSLARGSWSQCMRKNGRRLSMNRRRPRQVLECASPLSSFPESPVARHRLTNSRQIGGNIAVFGLAGCVAAPVQEPFDSARNEPTMISTKICSGSWNTRCLAGVFSGKDESPLALWQWRRANQKRQSTGAVQDATARSQGSWSQCIRKNERGLSMNLVAADVRRLTLSAQQSEPPYVGCYGSWPQRAIAVRWVRSRWERVKIVNRK